MLDKLKQLTKDTAVYGISTMFGRFLNFLLVPLYTHVFLPAEYGVIANIYAFTALMNIVFLYGMDSGFLKFASTKEIGDEKDNFSTPFFSVLITSFFLAGIIILFQKQICGFLSVPQEYNYLIYLVSAILFFDALAVIPFISLRLDRKAKRFAFLKILNIIINVSFVIILVVPFKGGVEAVFISNLIASAASFFMVFPSIIPKLRFSFNRELLNRILKFGLPYLPAGIGAMIIQVIDRPIMEHLTNLQTVGIYQANHKLGIFMMLFVNMFQFAWQPFFMQNAKEENAKEIFAKVLTYFTLIGSVILITLSIFIPDLVKISFFGRSIIGRAYWSGLDVVPIVLLGYLFNGIYIIFTAGIFIKEKSIYVPFIIGFAAIVNIISNFLLIPTIGMMGSAVSALLSYFTMAVGFYIVTQKIYTIQYEIARILKLFLINIFIGSVYYYLFYNNMLTMTFKILLILTFFLLLYIIIIEKKEKAYLLKLIHLG